MTTVEISEFKAKCQEFLDAVTQSGEALVITRSGKPLARILPFFDAPAVDWIGCLTGSARAVDDQIDPAVDVEEWEA